MLTSLCTGGYPRIVRREGRICRRLWSLVVSTCGMAHRLGVIRSAVVARHYGIVDGKRRRTHCPYQQRRGGKRHHYSLYSTQHTLLTLSLPSSVFTHAGAGLVRCEKAGTPRRIPRPALSSHGVDLPTRPPAGDVRARRSGRDRIRRAYGGPGGRGGSVAELPVYGVLRSSYVACSSSSGPKSCAGLYRTCMLHIHKTQLLDRG
jgi:hypothetical protein